MDILDMILITIRAISMSINLKLYESVKDLKSVIERFENDIESLKNRKAILNKVMNDTLEIVKKKLGERK
jgi:hypothetical protein